MELTSTSIIKTGAKDSPSSSAMAGRCRPMTGTRRCCSFSNTATASSPMTDEAFLWVQPAGRESIGGDHPELVAAGDDGRREGSLRWHRRLFTDRFHRRPQEDHGACTGNAWRRRSDRSLRRRRAIVGQIAKKRDAENLQGVPAWDAHHAGRHDQRRPARVHQSVDDFRSSKPTKRSDKTTRKNHAMLK